MARHKSIVHDPVERKRIGRDPEEVELRAVGANGQGKRWQLRRHAIPIVL